MTTKRNFKIGDVVALRSDGFGMTIESVDNDVARCVWADKGRIRRDQFQLACLMWWSELKPDFTLLIPGYNITEEEAARLPRVGVGNA